MKKTLTFGTKSPILILVKKKKKVDKNTLEALKWLREIQYRKQGAAVKQRGGRSTKQNPRG